MVIIITKLSIGEKSLQIQEKGCVDVKLAKQRKL
jgi:hypothetical protein